MDQRNQATLNLPQSILRGYEAVLLIATVLLCEYRMFIGTYLYILPDKDVLYHSEIRAGELVVLAFLLLLFLAALAVPRFAQRAGSVLRRFCTYDYCFLFFMPFWYVLCCLLRQRATGTASLRDNEWWIYITFVTSFIFFPLAGFAGAGRAKKVINPMLKAVLLPNMLFMAWILWKWFHNESVVFLSGGALSALERFSLSLGENRLHTANRSLAMLFLCLYLASAEKSWRRVLYGVGGLEYLAVLILTNNRGAWYPAVAVLALLAFVAVWHRCTDRAKFLRLLLAILCAAACVLCLFAVRRGMFRLAEQALHRSLEAEVSAQTVKAPAALPQAATLSASVGRPVRIAAAAPDVTEAAAEPAAVVHTLSDGLSAREPVYRGAFYLMFRDWRHFLFGMTHFGVEEALPEMNGQAWLSQPSAHNFFLQMGVAFGVPVMLLSFAFVLLLVIRCVRILSRREVPFPGARLVPAVVLPLLMADMFDTTLTAGNSLSCAVFYLFAGWVVAVDRTAPAEERCRDGVFVTLFTLGLSCFAAAAWWLYPWFRTLFSAGVGSVGQRLLLPVLTAAALLLLLWSLGRLLSAWKLRKIPLRKSLIFAPLASALLFALCIGVANSRLNRLTEHLSPLLEQERPALEAVRSVEGCKLLVESVPAVYGRTFGGVRREPFRVEDLTLRRDLVLLTDAEKEYSALFDRGYLYADISDRHAVYTRCPEAVRALEAAGYHLTGYYSHNWTVEMKPDGAMTYRGELNLPVAPHRAEFALGLSSPNGVALPEGETLLATLSAGMPGEEPLTVQEVKSSDYGEVGTSTVCLDFTPPAAGPVEFRLEKLALPEGWKLQLQSVRCFRHPDFDVHAEYDINGRRTHEAYFTLEGEVCTHPDGSQAKEFEYDRAGNMVTSRYLDSDGKLVLNSYGYAEGHFAYNGFGQVVREEYYGSDRKLIIVGSGYAICQHEYDDQGNLLLLYYYDAEGALLHCGSSNFHAYLKSLAGKIENGASVFISIRDEGTRALTPQLLTDLKELGLRTDLSGKMGYSYCAVIRPDGVEEKLNPDHPVSIIGTVDGVEYSIASAGYLVGDFSSILIGGTEYSKNLRGMNIVVFEEEIVTDSVAFDTYDPVMTMTK